MYLQNQAILASKVAENCKAEKRSQYRASTIQLVCRNCFKSVASGSDIKLIDNVHYVNVSSAFK